MLVVLCCCPVLLNSPALLKLLEVAPPAAVCRMATTAGLDPFAQPLPWADSAKWCILDQTGIEMSSADGVLSYASRALGTQCCDSSV